MKITKEIAQEVIDHYFEGNSSKDVKEKFGISRSYISRIVGGNVWKECKRPDNVSEIIKDRKQNPGSKITQEIAQNIIDEYVSGINVQELEKIYGLWNTTISNLISGRTWSKCKRPDNIKNLIKERHEVGLFKKGWSQEIHGQYPELTEKQKEILIGSMLGDGHLRKTCPRYPNSYFTKQQCKKYKKYVEWHHEQFLPFSISVSKVFSKHKLSFNKETQKIEREQVKKHLSAYAFRTCSHPVFTELRNIWYPNGKKIVPKNLELTPLSIAIWFCDDGSNSFSHREAIFCTHSFTLKEVKFLSSKLKEFDIKANVRFAKYASGKKPILKVNSQSYDTLINIIKPYIEWDCMKHKINWRPAKKQWEYSGKFTEDQITEIKDLRETKSAREIARQFEVHVNTIYAIVSGRSWKHMEAA